MSPSFANLDFILHRTHGHCCPSAPHPCSPTPWGLEQCVRFWGETEPNLKVAMSPSSLTLSHYLSGVNMTESAGTALQLLCTKVMSCFWDLGCWGNWDIANIQWDPRKEKVLAKGQEIGHPCCSSPCFLRPSDLSQQGIGFTLPIPHSSCFLARVKHTDAEVRWPWEGRRTGWRAIKCWLT